MTLATDGTAYAWVTGVDQGGTGVAWWSPNSGLVRVTDEIIPAGRIDTTTCRRCMWSGPMWCSTEARQWHAEIRHLRDRRRHPLGCGHLPAGLVAGADGGTIAVGLGGTSKRLPSSAGILRTDALPPLSC